MSLAACAEADLLSALAFRAVDVNEPSQRAAVAEGLRQETTRMRHWLTVSGALLGAAALMAALLAQGGRFSARLDVLTHFAPVYLCAGLASVVIAAGALPQWRAELLALGGLAMAAAAALMAPEFLPRQETAQPAGAQVKVVQFNAWGGNQDVDAAAAWILAQQPDVVVLQEGARVASRLVAAGLKSRRCDDCSVMILTRRPQSETYEVPAEAGVRSFLAAATVEDRLGAYTVVGVHRYWPIRRIRAQSQTSALRRLIGSYPSERLILAGDFNSTPWSFHRKREDRDLGLIRRTIALPTWPAARLSHNRLPAPVAYLPIDHVYAGAGWATVKVERGPRLGSDHYPVTVTLAPVDRSRRVMARQESRGGQGDAWPRR